MKLRKFVAAILIPIYFSGCSVRSHFPRSARGESIMQSSAGEVALGKQIHEYIISKIPVYNSPAVFGYVSKIGENLSIFAKRKNLSYQFIILRDDRIYATSTPGGFEQAAYPVRTSLLGQQRE